MAISVEEVRRIADLAKLRFTAEEEQRMAQDLSRVLDYVRKLEELDTDDIEPLSRIDVTTNVVRPDEPVQRITQDEALSNAPDHDGTYIRVPKVIS